MLLIGESLNVISKDRQGVQGAQPKPIQEEALFQKGKGDGLHRHQPGTGQKRRPRVDALGGRDVVQDVVPDVPLALDTSNIDAIEAALKVIKQVPSGTPHIVNSIMAARSATSAWCPWQPNTMPISSP
jgi:5-methyltetrahydrofolate corrinoid/iron sulfur protein methyltransferase